MRDILVHATGYDPWPHATEFAARLAATLDAALTGLWCIEPEVPVALAGELGGMAALAMQTPNPAIDGALACQGRFLAWASSLGVAHSDWFACEAMPAEALRQIGQWHDLIVLGAGKHTPWGSEAALADVLMTSHRPCLVVPESRMQWPRLDRIAIAWDASPSALRSVHAALPLLVRASRVVVLGSAKDTGEARLPMFDLDRFCERHELRVERVAFEPVAGPTGGALLRAAMAANADLMVLGAFGHSRLREWALGGVSRHMLAHSPIPLLMRH